MKIGLFTDCHYNKAELIGHKRCSADSYNKVKASMDAFKENNVDICFCLGDITDHVNGDTKSDIIENYKYMLSLINSYGIPFYLVPGNHDYLMTTGEEIEELLGKKLPPCVVKTEKYNIILLDANYRSNMERFDVAGVEWTDSNLPPYQVEFLKKELDSSSKECIVMVHENLDPNIHN
ncbi:MAG: metallophosphoesterase, partial [Clostridia bacterium]|nr:metallophosphoesterase [Clostridia bacterium]